MLPEDGVCYPLADRRSSLRPVNDQDLSPTPVGDQPIGPGAKLSPGRRAGRLLRPVQPPRGKQVAVAENRRSSVTGGRAHLDSAPASIAPRESGRNVYARKLRRITCERRNRISSRRARRSLPFLGVERHRPRERTAPVPRTRARRGPSGEFPSRPRANRDAGPGRSGGFSVQGDKDPDRERLGLQL